MDIYWQDLVRLAAAGGFGGILYWAIARREPIMDLARTLLRRR